MSNRIAEHRPSVRKPAESLPCHRAKARLAHKPPKGRRPSKGGCKTTDRFSIPGAPDLQKTLRIHEEIVRGEYETPARLDRAIDRMLIIELEPFQEFYY